MTVRCTLSIFACAFLVEVVAPVHAALPISQEDLQVSAYVDGGRFQLADSSVDGEVLNRMGSRWLIDKQIDDHWSAMATLQWMFWRNQATDIALFHVAGLKFDSDLQGILRYKTGNSLFKGGLYEFKYNPDSKNLGEYLLRSEAYPTLVESSQGKDLLAYSYSRVMGVEYGLHGERFSHTALLYAEQFNVPVNDLSAVYLATYGSETAELGLGVAYHRFLDLGKKMNNNVLAPAQRQYVEANNLETKAVKLSLRGRVDFGAMQTSLEGFKLYAEAALLGLKSDTLFYKNMKERLPVMMGVDIPTHGFLNTLSVETEYFGNPYYERKYSIKDANGGNFSPLPFIDDYQAVNIPHVSKDDWRWSVYVHKALNKWIDFKVRGASDHLRLLNWDGDYEGGTPMTRRTKDFYILARIEFHN